MKLQNNYTDDHNSGPARQAFAAAKPATQQLLRGQNRVPKNYE